MKINFRYLWINYRFPALRGLGMVCAGLLTAGLAAHSDAVYPPPVPREVAAATPAQAKTVQEATPAAAKAATSSQAQPEEPAQPVLLPDLLNLAQIPLSEEEDNGQSLAEYLLDELGAREGSWTARIYDIYNESPASVAASIGMSTQSLLGKYHPQAAGQDPQDPSTWIVPEFKGIQASISNGTGQTSGNMSNIKEILAMANVLNYYGVLTTPEELLDYAQDLWSASHSYSCQISGVYYCQGCMEKTQTEEESPQPILASDSQATRSEAVIVEGVDGGPGVGSLPEETASESLPSQTEAETDIPSSQAEAGEEESTLFCPGHVDLSIQIQITGIQNGLFSLDGYETPTPETQALGWPGWNQETMGYVRALEEQDWYEDYGLTTDSLFIRNPLSSLDMDLYMSMVPQDVSEQRKEVVRFALSSVGRVPYYWGGKPWAKGYDGNQFGSVTTPDVDGRFLRGLDCSGWVSWVYWSATGSRLGGESTLTLTSCGQAISKDELLPGDICIRTTGEAHVVIFLGWTAEGRMLCIQETSGNINNVEVGIVTPDWDHYRRLIH